MPWSETKKITLIDSKITAVEIKTFKSAKTKEGIRKNVRQLFMNYFDIMTRTMTNSMLEKCLNGIGVLNKEFSGIKMDMR